MKIIRTSLCLLASALASAASALDLGVPVFDTSLLTESNRVTYLEEFRRAGVTKVYVATNLGRLKPSIWPERTEKLREIVRFFETGVPPVSAEETLEIYTFLEAAAQSKRRGGAVVTLAEVLAAAKR